MNLFSETSENLAIGRILLKVRFFLLHVCHMQYGSFINHFYIIAPSPNAAEFGRIMQNNGHY